MEEVGLHRKVAIEVEGQKNQLADFCLVRRISRFDKSGNEIDVGRLYMATLERHKYSDKPIMFERKRLAAEITTWSNEASPTPVQQQIARTAFRAMGVKAVTLSGYNMLIELKPGRHWQEARPFVMKAAHIPTTATLAISRFDDFLDSHLENLELFEIYDPLSKGIRLDK